MRALPTALLTALLLSPAALADDADRLVTDLRSDVYIERETAHRALEAMGQAARPALVAASRSGDPEVRTRARELLARLDPAAPVETVLRPFGRPPLVIVRGLAIEDLQAQAAIWEWDETAAFPLVVPE